MTWTDEELRVELDRYETELRDAGKARNTIATYVQPVERFLNWLAGRYSPKRAADGLIESTSPAHQAHGGGKSKYDGLRAYLANRPEPVIPLSFSEIEKIIGGQLPPSARRYPAWWANEQAGTHVHARAWLDVGRRTANVDMNATTIDFVL